MAVFLWLVAALMVVLTVVDPRKLWYSTSAWQYKNPEANEPSEVSFALGRFMTGIVAIGFGIAAIVATVNGVAPLSQDRLDRFGRQAATELSGPTFKYSVPDAEDVLEAIGRNDVVTADVRSEQDEDAPFGEPDPTTDYISLTSKDDAAVVGCMTVSYEGGLFADQDIDVDVDYSAGAC